MTRRQAMLSVLAAVLGRKFGSKFVAAGAPSREVYWESMSITNHNAGVITLTHPDGYPVTLQKGESVTISYDGEWRQ